MGQPADADIEGAFPACGDDVVDGLELALAADEEDAGVPVDPGEIEVILQVEGRLLHHPVENLGPHVAEQQFVAIVFRDAHVLLVADPARRTRVVGGLEFGIEIIFPDTGEGAMVAVGAAAFAGRHVDLDIALRKRGRQRDLHRQHAQCGPAQCRAGAFQEFPAREIVVEDIHLFVSPRASPRHWPGCRILSTVRRGYSTADAMAAWSLIPPSSSTPYRHGFTSPVRWC